MQAPVIFMLLVTAAVLVWPGRRRLQPAYEFLGRASDGHGRGGSAGGCSGETISMVDRIRWLAHEDPVEVLRAAWARSRSRRRASADALDEALLGVLDALEPALVAGLTPARALELAAPSVGTGTAPRPGPAGLDRGSVGRVGVHRDGMGSLVEEAVRAAEAGSSVGRVWQRWADDTGSRTLGFVAAAWLLSERTGAPLAEAVARASARTRAELSRRRRVTSAVAGPRATVNVLSALPLVGPLFGLASGLDPSEVYLSSPVVVGAVGFGFVLLLVGRWWCRRLVASVLEPS